MFEMTMHAAARQAAAFGVLRSGYAAVFDVTLDLCVARVRAIGSLKLSGRRMTRSGYLGIAFG
jgi:hypothetical protein